MGQSPFVMDHHFSGENKPEKLSQKEPPRKRLQPGLAAPRPNNLESWMAILKSFYTELPLPLSTYINIVIKFLLWMILFVMCWPLALAALLIFPLVWILLLPFRLVGIAVGGALALVWAVVTLPVRVLHRI